MFTVTVSAIVSYIGSPEQLNWADPPHPLILLSFFMLTLTAVSLVNVRVSVSILEILPEKLLTNQAVQPFLSSFHLLDSLSAQPSYLVRPGPTIYYVECT
jgi:hypothetical protein